MILFLGILPTSVLSLAGLVLFFRLRLDRDPDLKVAGKVSAALTVAALIQIACALPEPDSLFWTGLGALPVSFLFNWALIYVGLTLSMRAGHAFWLVPGNAVARKRVFRIALMGALAAAGYTCVLFAIFNPRLGETAREIFKDRGTTVSIAIWILLAAVSEEFTYRGVFQNMLRRWIGDSPRARFTVINASAVVWAVAHVGVLSPDWVKIIQIYPLGLFLGWQFRRHGLLATITTHATFNILAATLIPFVTGWDPK